MEGFRVRGENSEVVSTLNKSDDFFYINDNDDDEGEGEWEEGGANEVESVQYDTDTWPQEFVGDTSNDYSTVTRGIVVVMNLRC
jgi:hypothetical protein